MIPVIPPSTLHDLGKTLFSRETPAMTHDPDHFFANEALRPDPAMVGLRALFAIGPIGALMRWIDRKIEAREERIFGTPDGDRSGASTTEDRENLPVAPSRDMIQDWDIAA
jgi:hypothetical protein